MIKKTKQKTNRQGHSWNWEYLGLFMASNLSSPNDFMISSAVALTISNGEIRRKKCEMAVGGGGRRRMTSHDSRA